MPGIDFLLSVRLRWIGQAEAAQDKARCVLFHAYVALANASPLRADPVAYVRNYEFGEPSQAVSEGSEEETKTSTGDHAAYTALLDRYCPRFLASATFALKFATEGGMTGAHNITEEEPKLSSTTFHDVIYTLEQVQHAIVEWCKVSNQNQVRYKTWERELNFIVAVSQEKASVSRREDDDYFRRAASSIGTEYWEALRKGSSMCQRIIHSPGWYEEDGSYPAGCEVLEEIFFPDAPCNSMPVCYIPLL